MLWRKRAHQSTIFQTFGISNESSPNSSRHIWNHKLRVYLNFASLFSVFLQLKPCILWTKKKHQKVIFRLLTGWVKIYQIPHIILETTSQFFLNFTSVLNVMRDNSFVFFSWDFIWFGQKKPIKVKVSDFQLLTWNFTKFVLW